MFAIERLMREGVRGDTARDLVVSQRREKCLRYAEALDTQQGIRNRASFLVSAIRKGYALVESPEPVEEPLGTPWSRTPHRSGKRSCTTPKSPPLPYRRTRPLRGFGAGSSSMLRRR